MLGAYTTDGALIASVIALALWGIGAGIKYALASRVRDAGGRLWPLAAQLGLPVQDGQIRGHRGSAALTISGSGRSGVAILLDHAWLPRRLPLSRNPTPARDERWRLAILTDAEQAEVVAALDAGWVLLDGRLRRTLEQRGAEAVEAAIAEGLRLVALLAPQPDELERLLGAVRHGDEATPELALDVLLERHARAPETARLIDELLQGARPELTLRVLLARPDAPGASAALTRILARSSGRDLAPDEAAALGLVPYPGAEELLVAALVSSDDKLVAAAIDSLANVGTVAAVGALLPLRDDGLAHRRRAADAILAIQARVGREAGALALAAGGGELAVSESAGREA